MTRSIWLTPLICVAALALFGCSGFGQPVDQEAQATHPVATGQVLDDSTRRSQPVASEEPYPAWDSTNRTVQPSESYPFPYPDMLETPVPLSTRVSTPIPTALPATDTPTPTREHGISPSWLGIGMFDEMNGWGYTDQSVLITTDGGAHWKDVTPQRVLDSKSNFSAFFVDANTGWVGTQFDEPNLILFRTLDGGRTWESFATPLYHVYFVFVDSENGWALEAYECGAGSCGGFLYRTTDGGNNWEQIHAIDPYQVDDQNTIPFGGIKEGMIFSDAKHGWLTGSYALPGFVYLYCTKDGGVTWQHQDILRSPDTEKEDVALDPPQFFTVQEGVLPVVFQFDQPLLVLYMTWDGGATWKKTTGIEKSEYRTVYDCASLQDCWVVDGETLIVSHDGAQTWTQITPNIKMDDFWKLEFVNSKTGWALSFEESGIEPLYRTDDGGLTWNPITP